MSVFKGRRFIAIRAQGASMLAFRFGFMPVDSGIKHNFNFNLF